MDTNLLLDEAKRCLKLDTDYKLAKALEINKGRISEYRKGGIPDAYACGRLAEVLGLDALQLIAQVEAETEKNATRKAWWARFLSSLPRSVGMIACALWTWGVSSPAGPGNEARAETLNDALRRMRPSMI